MKKIFILSVFVFFVSNVISQGFSSIEITNCITFPEVFLDTNDQQLDKSIKDTFQNCIIFFSFRTNNSLVHTYSFFYQPDMAGHIQPKKMILRI